MMVVWNRAAVNTVNLLLLVVPDMMFNDIRWSACSSRPSLPRVYKSGVTLFSIHHIMYLCVDSGNIPQQQLSTSF